MGDGVNIAARLEGVADRGGICISRQVLDQVEGKLDLTYRELGRQNLKNNTKPVEVPAPADRAARERGYSLVPWREQQAPPPTAFALSASWQTGKIVPVSLFAHMMETIATRSDNATA